MSQVINWLTKTRGPESIVVAGDWYDYELNVTVFVLPEEKKGVLKGISNLFAEMDPQYQENIVLSVRAGLKDGWTEYEYDNFVDMGVSTIHKQVIEELVQHWDKPWALNGYVTDTDGTWEFNFRRINFV